jgi:hypothetical protein
LLLAYSLQRELVYIVVAQKLPLFTQSPLSNGFIRHNIYQITEHHIPRESYLRKYHSENIEYHFWRDTLFSVAELQVERTILFTNTERAK